MLQVKAVPARADRAISAMKSLHPGFVQLPGGFWGDVFILPMFAYCICVSEKGRKRTFNSNRAQ